jgi:2-iminobutanoate/2-iminopropanoate deaminase
LEEVGDFVPKRQVLEIPGLGHGGQPIPLAVKIGALLFSSALSGQDAATNSVPDEPAKQVEFAFANVKRVIEAAGATTADIAKVTVYLKDMQHRELINREWLKMFPDEHDRPVRHTLKADLGGNRIVQLEFIAVL